MYDKEVGRKGFAQFANFRRAKGSGSEFSHLQLKTGIDPEHLNWGGYCYVFPLEESRVLKVNTFLRFDDQKQALDYHYYPPHDAVLVKKEKKRLFNILNWKKNAAEDRERVVRGLRELAATKQKLHEALLHYFPGMVPELYGMIVGDSPRRSLEEMSVPKKLRLDQKGALLRFLASFPEREITLMEVWEKVDVKNSFENLAIRKDYTLLRETITKAVEGGRLEQFANAAYYFFLEEGVMIDLCDERGILFRNAGRIQKTREPAVLLELLKSKTYEHPTLGIPVPKGIVLGEDGVKLYDIYPINFVRDELTKPFQDEIVKFVSALRDNDAAEQERILQIPNFRDGEKMLLCYFTFLKKLGCRFSKH